MWLCQNESLFNQEDRKKKEATENYWICFHLDNYQIKQIPFVKQLIHSSNQQAGQQHLLPGGDLRQMWRCGDDTLSESLLRFEGGLFHPFEVLCLAWKGECNPVYKFSRLFGKFDWASHTFKAKFCLSFIHLVFSAVMRPQSGSLGYFACCFVKDKQFQGSQATFVWPRRGI